VITLRADEKRQAAEDYATTARFCWIFQRDMQSLYLLAFLLTANHERAEQSFFAGLEDALNERRVFKEWALPWSRRSVIKNAIRLIAAPSAQSHEPDCWGATHNESAACTTINAITQLALFDRIVFVMTVLERYSEWECGLLLDCSSRDVHTARVRALQQLPALYRTTAANAENFHCATEKLQHA